MGILLGILDLKKCCKLRGVVLMEVYLLQKRVSDINLIEIKARIQRKKKAGK